MGSATVPARIALVFALAFACLMSSAVAASAAPTQISYVVMPHPDDEYNAWSLITGSGSNYKVFIYLTQGEETAYCGSDSGAKSAYQGPGSPVSQPDYGEINPLGTGTDIWKGKWSSTCKQARRASAHGFLASKAAPDSSIPTGLALAGSTSFTGNTLAGLPPRRVNDGVVYESRTAVWYNSTNGMGKVIYFDLGDGDLTKEEVQWAISKVRANKSTFGIPTLPEINMMSAYRNLNISTCDVYDHPDHKAVHDALWQYDMTSGPQYGRTCGNDPDHDPGRTKTISSTEHNATKNATTTTRTGSFQRRYGWLAQYYWDSGWGTNERRAATQHFWSRFN